MSDPTRTIKATALQMHVLSRALNTAALHLAGAVTANVDPADSDATLADGLDLAEAAEWLLEFAVLVTEHPADGDALEAVAEARGAIAAVAARR